MLARLRVCLLSAVQMWIEWILLFSVSGAYLQWPACQYIFNGFHHFARCTECIIFSIESFVHFGVKRNLDADHVTLFRATPEASAIRTLDRCVRCVLSS